MLRHFASILFTFFVHMGGVGQLLLGILDSSFLVMPLGNDLLMVVLTANHHDLMVYYAAMATAGSVLGVLLVDVVVRRGGEEGLEKHLPPRQLEYIKKKVKDRAWLALTIASLAPPPFPFTPFVIGAAALQYPRRKFLTVIGIWRMVRFTIEGALAMRFGRQILKWGEAPQVWYAVLALIVISIVGSVLSVVSWIKRSKKAIQEQPREA